MGELKRGCIGGIKKIQSSIEQVYTKATPISGVWQAAKTLNKTRMVSIDEEEEVTLHNTCA